MLPHFRLRSLISLVLAVVLVATLPTFALADEAADHTAAAAGDHASADHAASGVRSPLTFDPDLAWVTVIVFVGLLLFLWFFAWPPIMQALDARERSITDNIRAAEAKHEEAKQVLAQHEARLAMAKDEVRALLEEARRDADATKAAVAAEAEAAARAERERAIREIGRARDGAIRQLAEESANLAIDLAGKVVGQKLSPGNQAELVNEAMGRLAGSSPIAN